MNDNDKAVTKAGAELPATLDPIAGIISRLDPNNVPPEQLEKYMDLAERHSREMAWQAFIRARAEFDRRRMNIPPNKKIMGGKPGEKKWVKAEYADRAQIMRHIGPLLSELGFTISYRDTVNQDGSITTACIVSHIDGHTDDSGSFTGPAQSDLVQMSPYQKQGAASEYRRRYALLNAFGLPHGSDDENELPAERAPEPINEEQAADLDSLLSEVKADRPGFLKFFGIEALESLPANRYGEAVRMCEAKRKQ